jgi:quercetin dioxygenase-like cupin family protein
MDSTNATPATGAPAHQTAVQQTAANQTPVLYRWDDMKKEELNPLLHRRLISTDRMMIAHVYLEQGCVVPKHSHENEQLTYLLSGSMRFWFGDDESHVVEIAAGEVLHIPSHLPHKAEALEATLDVDIFCPPRADWLDGSDSYLRAK